MSSQQRYTDISHLIDEARKLFTPSSGRPEAEPMVSTQEVLEDIGLQEVVEHEPDDDVKPYIHAHKESIALPTDLKDIGVEATPAPVQYPTYVDVKVPLTDDQIVVGLKQPTDSSFRWLAELCKYILRKVHIRLKIAHNKALRAFEK